MPATKSCRFKLRSLLDQQCEPHPGGRQKNPKITPLKLPKIAAYLPLVPLIDSLISFHNNMHKKLTTAIRLNSTTQYSSACMPICHKLSRHATPLNSNPEPVRIIQLLHSARNDAKPPPLAVSNLLSECVLFLTFLLFYDTVSCANPAQL